MSGDMRVRKCPGLSGTPRAGTAHVRCLEAQKVFRLGGPLQCAADLPSLTDPQQQHFKDSFQLGEKGKIVWF